MSQSPISPPTPPSPPDLPPPPPVDPPPVTPPPEAPPVSPPPVSPPPETPPVTPTPVTPPPETPPVTPPPPQPPIAPPTPQTPPVTPPPPRPPIAPPTPETPPVTPTPPSPETPPVTPTPPTPETPPVPPPPTPDTPPGTPMPPSLPVTPTPPSPNRGPPSTAPPPRQLLSPPPVNSTSAQSSSPSLSTSAIAGIAAGGIIGLIILALFVFFLSKKRNRRDFPSDFPGLTPPRGDTYELQYPAQHVVKIPPSNPQTSSVITGSSINSPGPEDPLLNPLPGFSLAKSKITFTYEELSAATDGFSDAKLLGQGGFGYVHLGTLPDGKQVAVKQLKVGSVQGEREFHAEVEIISRVHHRHLVSLVGYCIHGGKRLLVYEYVPNNTLEYQLHGKGRPVLDWPTRLKIALGAAKGLAYLHEDCQPKIIHRDIKASNILLDYKFEAKLADFGLAKSASDANTHVSTRVMGTFGYLAPEYAASGKLTDKSDVFSFGVMLLELITGRRPVNTSNDTFMEDSLVDWARPKLVQVREDGNLEPIVDPRLQGNYDPDEMLRLIACAATCVRHSARRRPRISQIVRVLEGDISLEDLNEGLTPGQSLMYGSSTEYDKGQYSEDMKRFRKLVLDSQDYLSSEYSEPSSQYGQNQSISSSEDFPSREMENKRRYSEDMKKFQKPPLGNREYTSSEYSATTSEFGLNQTMSSTEEYTTRESDIPKSRRKNTKGFSGGAR